MDEINEKNTEMKIESTPKKRQQTKTKIKIEDNDTSKESLNIVDPIEELKKKPIANAPIEEEVIDIYDIKNEKENKGYNDNLNVERFYDVNILEGLTDEQVNKRIEENLVNVSEGKHGKSILGIILSNIFTFFNMLYLVITVLFVYFKSFDNLFYLLIIIPNLGIGIYQEIKAKLTIQKLSLLSAPTTTVTRNKEKVDIPVSDIVLDDVAFFTPGKQISADSIVLEGSVEANEALLTGESDPIIKNPGDKLFSGSFVVSGSCAARIDKVGKDNYIEKLSATAKTYDKPKSQLLKTLGIIVKVISFIIIPLGVWTFLVNYNIQDGATSFDINSIKSIDFSSSMIKGAFLKAAASMIAMVPAGLFLLTTMALFVSVARLAKKNTLVQELYCIEMLARVNVLCLDKTGTITDGTMRVCDCVEIKNYTDYTIREIIGSMMNSFEETNATSDALIKYFEKNKVLTPTQVIPFSSKRKFSAVTFGKQGTFLLGAPEFVIKDNYERISAKVERFASQGCRVLALGHSLVKIKGDTVPPTVRPLALIVIQDHIRDDAAETINYFKENGVDVKVISGDNPVTVSEIATRVGIQNGDRYISLEGMSDDEVKQIAFDYTVFGRVTPSQKRVLVKTFKDHKKTVAMTGDGVNDILALKEADCSIAMASGSEATRYVAHLVLMDSNFSSMPKVVSEGRRVINNIQRTSSLFLVKTIFAVLLTIMYNALFREYPFQTKHLYMIELFSVGVPAFFLSLQPNKDIVKGKFIINVIKNALPSALSIVCFHALLTHISSFELFNEIFASQELYTTYVTLVSTTVCMLLLYKVSTPFNLLRKVLYLIMTSGCILVILSQYTFIPLISVLPFFKGILCPMNINQVIFVLLAMMLSYPLTQIITRILQTLRIISK